MVTPILVVFAIAIILGISYYFLKCEKKVTFNEKVEVITFEKDSEDIFDNIKQIEKFTQSGLVSKYIDEGKYIESAEYV